MEIDTKAQAELVEWVKSAAEKGGEFLERETPLYVNELLAWEFWSNIFACCASVAGAIALAIFAVIMFRAVVRMTHDAWISYGPAFAIPAAVASALSPILVCLVSIPAAYSAVKAHVAPRVVVMETLTARARK